MGNREVPEGHELQTCWVGVGGCSPTGRCLNAYGVPSFQKRLRSVGATLRDLQTISGQMLLACTLDISSFIPKLLLVGCPWQSESFIELCIFAKGDSGVADVRWTREEGYLHLTVPRATNHLQTSQFTAQVLVFYFFSSPAGRGALNKESGHSCPVKMSICGDRPEERNVRLQQKREGFFVFRPLMQ